MLAHDAVYNQRANLEDSYIVDSCGTGGGSPNWFRPGGALSSRSPTPALLPSRLGISRKAQNNVCIERIDDISNWISPCHKLPLPPPSHSRSDSFPSSHSALLPPSLRLLVPRGRRRGPPHDRHRPPARRRPHVPQPPPAAPGESAGAREEREELRKRGARGGRGESEACVLWSGRGRVGGAGDGQARRAPPGRRAGSMGGGGEAGVGGMGGWYATHTRGRTPWPPWAHFPRSCGRTCGIARAESRRSHATQSRACVFI